MLLNITKVTSKSTKKDGTAYINKNGKPFFVIGIQASQYGQQWINGFYNTVPAWEGTQQELDIKEEDWQGKKQLKFEVPKAKAGGVPDGVAKDISQILFKLGAMNVKINDIHAVLHGKKLGTSTPLALSSNVPFPMPDDRLPGEPVMPTPAQNAAFDSMGDEIRAEDIPW